MRRSIGVITVGAAACAGLAFIAAAQDTTHAPGAPPLAPQPFHALQPFSAPQPFAPQPFAPQPGPQQPARYTLLEQDLSILVDDGESSFIGTVTLLFDSATGDASYLVRQGDSLAWRPIQRHPMGPHQPPAGQPVVTWTNPPIPAAPPVPSPFPSTPPMPAPPGAPYAPVPQIPPMLPQPSLSPPTPSGADTGPATPPRVGNPLVDTTGFRQSVSEADRLRSERRVGEAAFLALATPESVILDCRSPDRFARLHVRGAVNLPFPDITAEELARLIPSPATRVLLYCNNNFADAPAAFPAKVAGAALNHHTFATLVAYGYRNVFELGPLVDVATTDIPLDGDDAP